MLKVKETTVLYAPKGRTIRVRKPFAAQWVWHRCTKLLPVPRDAKIVCDAGTGVEYQEFRAMGFIVRVRCDDVEMMETDGFYSEMPVLPK